MIAVAVPAAFATSQAAAQTASTPSTLEAKAAPSDTDLVACDELVKAPAMGDSCQTIGTEDLSGQRIEQRFEEIREDPRDGAVAKSAGVLVIVVVLWERQCRSIGYIQPGAVICNWVVVGVLVIWNGFGLRAGDEPAPIDSAKDEIVAPS